jgi:hypothetical protein
MIKAMQYFKAMQERGTIQQRNLLFYLVTLLLPNGFAVGAE